MADAAVATPGTSADVVARFVRSEGTLDAANNRSYVYADLYLKLTAANGAGGPIDNNDWSTAYINSSLGSMGTWQGHYNLSPASSLPQIHLIHWEGWVTHDADGTKTVTFTFGFSGQGGTPLGVGNGSDSITLTKLTQVPGVPTGVALVRSTDTAATCSWTRNEASNGVATSFQVQTSVNGAAFAQVVSISAASSVVLVTAANQKVVARVRATNSAGSSAYSADSAPSYTTPAAPTGVGAVKDASLNIVISWTPNVAFVEHEHVIEESTDGGGSWGALTTIASGTSTYTHTAPNPATTHTYRVRARNTSGGLTSAWVQSPTVQLLAPPNKPTLPTLPAFVAADLDYTLTWVHNPVDTTPQSAYEVEFSTDGGSTWPTTTGKTTSAVSAYLIPDGTYDPADAVTVRVRTWGQATTGGSETTGGSPWSDPQTVTFKSAPVVTVTTPADESTYGDAQLTVTLGFSQAEGASFVQATVTLNDGSDDLETVVSGTPAGIGFTTTLLNGGEYTLTATVLDSNGLTSAAVVSTFDVAYTLPVEAVVSVTYLPEQGVTQLDLEFPTPGVGEATAAAVTITRAVDGGDPEPIITAYTITDSLLTVLDTTPTIHGINTYMVRTISEDGAIADVTEELTTAESATAFLSTGTGFGTIVSFRSNLQFASDPARASALVQAAGRRSPIALFGVQESLVISGSATIFADEGSTWQELELFLQTAGIVCYRDPSGRRIFGQVSGSVSVPSSIWQEFQYRVVEAT